MVPKNIFQTHKSLDYIKSNKLLLNAQNTWKENKSFNYYFYDDLECDKFMSDFFPDIKHIYDKLPLKVMKADLWRYCIIFKYGGIYADSDTAILVNPNFLIINNKNLIVVPENNTHFCQWVFAAPPNSPILKSVIDLSVERIENIKEFKGEHIVHYLTGPGVFTDGILRYLRLPIRKYDHINLNYLDHNFIPLKYGKEGGILDYESNFNEIKIGNSNTNTKIISLNKKYPSNTEITFVHNYSDTFKYTIKDNNLYITRTDKNSGWGQDLIGYINSMDDMFVFKSEIFHKKWIKHLFSGGWSNGWCKERELLIKS